MALQRVATPSRAGTPRMYVSNGSGHTTPDEAITYLSAHSSGSSVCQIVIDIVHSACPGSREQRTGFSVDISTINCSSMPGNSQRAICKFDSATSLCTPVSGLVVSP